MNYFIKTKLILGLLSVSVASVSYGNTDIHLNAHEFDGASALLDAWENNRVKANDPIKRIMEGYSEQKSDGADAYYESNYVNNRMNYSLSEAEGIHSSIENRRSNRASQLSSIINSVVDDEGNVDYEEYKARYSEYLANTKGLSMDYYNARQESFSAVTRDAALNNSTINTTVGNNTSRAAYNVLALARLEFLGSRNAIINAFESNIDKTVTSQEFGSLAVAEAGVFSGDCPACEINYNPIEPVAEPDPPEEVEEPAVPEEPFYRDRIENCGIDQSLYANQRYYICP